MAVMVESVVQVVQEERRVQLVHQVQVALLVQEDLQLLLQHTLVD
jgi:hypothetical protein